MDGTTTGTTSVDPRWFDVKPNAELLKQVVVALASQRRQVIAHTKTRGNVRGGGKKPWKQKGTGRARQGSIRSPQWRGGGVVFGPTNERNPRKEINKKMKQKALLVALSDRVRSGSVAIIDPIVLPEQKTKVIAKAFLAIGKTSTLPLAKGCLFIRSSVHDLAIPRLARNLKSTTVVEPNSIGVESVLAHPVLLFTKSAIQELTAKFESQKKSPAKSAVASEA